MLEGTITICSVGDLMISDSPLYASVGVGSRYSEIRSRLMDACKKQMSEADIVIGNFETVVYKPKNNSLNETQMACEETVIKDLREIGFSIFNVANNHCLQHGTEGFNNTIEACRNNGIEPIGIKNQNPLVIEVKGKKIAFLSLCIHLEWYQPDNVLYESSIERILREIKEIRSQDEGTLIVVAVHWGDEFAKYPSNAQILLGHEFVDMGANIILGHHSHVFQGIEKYKGSLIAYSQGNFISDMIPEMCCQTGIIKIKINPSNTILHELVCQNINEDYCLISSDDRWIKERQEELEKAILGSYSDDDYWRAISKNHAQAHKDFKRFFKKNILKYKLNISTKMIIEYIIRKVQRIIGVSSDGRVSSMDASILNAVRKNHKE